jgi:hypothetical protein
MNQTVLPQKIIFPESLVENSCYINDFQYMNCDTVGPYILCRDFVAFDVEIKHRGIRYSTKSALTFPSLSIQDSAERIANFSKFATATFLNKIPELDGGCVVDKDNQKIFVLSPSNLFGHIRISQGFSDVAVKGLIEWANGNGAQLCYDEVQR